MQDLGKKVALASGVDLGRWQQQLYRMMAGHQEDSPFTSEEVDKASAFLKSWCRDHGVDPERKEGDIHDAPDLRLIQSLLFLAGDPDAAALDIYCKGVRLGYNQVMPRAPAVYDPKEEWRLEYEPPESASVEWAPNYKTARENESVLVEKIKRKTLKRDAWYARPMLQQSTNSVADSMSDRWALLKRGTPNSV